MIIDIDYKSDVPIYLQLRNEIVKAIANGKLSFGDQLPTIRSLALDLGVNTMTVNKAYSLLKTQGYIQTDRRHGAFVTAKSQMPTLPLEELKQDLSLLISEATLSGYNRDEFLRLCKSLYPSCPSDS